MTSQQDKVQPTDNCKYCGGGDPKCSNYVSANHYVTQFQQDTELESLLLERVKVISDGEWTLLGTPSELIQALTSWKDKEVIRELQAVYKNIVKHDIAGVVKWDVDDRIKSLQSQGGKNG